ncbi:MAG: nucleotidyltransferase family protein [Anaerolineales bacterium]
MKNIKKFLVNPQASIKDVITCIDKNVRGIALVVNDDGQLIGTVTDGDIRRAILDKFDLDSSVLDLLSQKGSDLYKKPITAPVGTSESDLLKLMDEYLIRQIPLLDENGRVVEISLLSELIQKRDMPLNAVVMAGGYGRRLGPLTEKVPKPMLPVGDRPLMERIIEQLRESGIKQVNISTHYMADMIKEHFDDGSDFGVDINYVNETRPLGTAGALSLMEPPDQPLLVVNGDIMSRIDFRALYNFHQEHNADLTVGVRQFDMEVPYGVLECEGPNVHRLREKPKFKFLVNAGIYLLEPEVLGFIPSDKRYDMTDLIVRLIDEGLKVVSFPIVEYWLDIGEPIDYKQAQMDLNEWEDAD